MFYKTKTKNIYALTIAGSFAYNKLKGIKTAA